MADDNMPDGKMSDINTKETQQKFLQQVIPAAQARQALAPILGENIAPGSYAISSKPGIGASSRIPTAMCIASGGHVLCLHQDFYAAHVAFEAAQKLDMFCVRIMDPTKPSMSLDEITDASTRMIYTTYGSLLYSPDFAEKALQWATHLVIDDAHEWSIDQQVVLLHARYLAGREDDPTWNNVVQVHLTAFAETVTFEHCIKPDRPSQAWRYMEVDKLHDDKPSQPQVFHSDKELKVDDYCAWVKDGVDAMMEKSRRILVFCPTLDSVGTLSVSLGGPGRKVLFVDPKSTASVKAAQNAMSDSKSHVLVLVRPHFGARTHLAIDDVFCPSFNEDVVLDYQVGQPCLTVRRLPADRIAFLASHASARVHCGFTPATDRNPTAGPVWLEGDCIEYYLKLVFAGPPTNMLILPDFPRPSRANLSPPSHIAASADRLMKLQYLCSAPHQEEGFDTYQITDRGAEVVEWMLATGLGWSASTAIYQYTNTESIEQAHHYTHIVASTMIVLAVIDLHLPCALVRSSHISQRPGGTQLAILETTIDKHGNAAGFPARVSGDLFMWLLALEHGKATQYEQIPGWHLIESFPLGPLVERIGAFAKTKRIDFQMPTPASRMQSHQSPNYGLGLRFITHFWVVTHVSRTVCVPILDDDGKEWDDDIIFGWDVGSNLMVRLDHASLLDIRRAREMVLKSGEPTLLLTYRHIYRLPVQDKFGCLFGVSGLTFMHPNTVETLTLYLNVGPGRGFHPVTGMTGTVTTGLCPNLFEANKVGGRSEFLKNYPSLKR